MLERKLSIVIPTYNRRGSLLCLLKRIYQQESSNRVEIVVCDNHSDYDVEIAVEEELSSYRTDNLHIFKNTVNIGMCANLSLLFFRCKTEWMWTLSDDDVIVDGAIDIVLKDIEVFNEYGLLKYSRKGHEFDENQTIRSINDLINYFGSRKDASGDLIFLSNNVYNMNRIMPYFDNTLSNCNTAIGHLIPVLNMLNKKGGGMRVLRTPIVDFYLAPSSATWNFLSVTLGVSTLIYLPFELTQKDYFRLLKVITGNFSHFLVIDGCLSIKDRKRANFLYKEIYRKLFRKSGYLVDKLYYMFFYICLYSGLRVTLERAYTIRESIRRVFPSFK